MFITRVVWLVTAVFAHVASGRFAFFSNYDKKSAFFNHYSAAKTKLNFTQLAWKSGQPCEEHDITTEDGYITKVFRLPGDKLRPVFITHGNLGSADDFILRGRTSLPVALREAGYDVWLGNCRGNRYSRRHVYLNPDRDNEFWNFTFEECALIDTAAAIDYILNFTGQEKLSTIGYSVGTTLFYVLSAVKPEYNKKISIQISMAPISYVHNSENLLEYQEYVPLFHALLRAMGIEEINNENALYNRLRTALCSNQVAATVICFDVYAFQISGFDRGEIEPEFRPTIFQYFPSSSSIKGQDHLNQIGFSKRFARFDYGYKKNLAVYGSELPEEYDLSAAEIKVALISGKNDLTSVLEDVKLLKEKLPNVVSHTILEPELFNHLDFAWGRNANKQLHPHIFDLLQLHS